MKCPFCEAPMEHKDYVYYERGEWDGSRYEEEANIPAHVCTQCKAEIAVISKGENGSVHQNRS